MSLDSMSPEGVSLLGAKAGAVGPSPQPAPAGIDGVSGLVFAVVGITPEEVLEPGVAFVEPVSEIELGHRQLVLIGE